MIILQDLTWVLFLANKYATLTKFAKLCEKLQNEKGFTITRLELIMVVNLNHASETFCEENGLEHELNSKNTTTK